MTKLYKVLIIFGSKSDEAIYQNILNNLKDNENIHYEMRICSAHRTPEELNRILNTDANIIIAGAGLAAHLPGVIASKTIKPVIGVPVMGNYQGLDALLSIMQMPPGIPVLTTGINKSDIAAKQATLMLNQYDTVHLLGEEKSKAMKKAIEVFKEFDIPYELNPQFEAGSLNIKFIALDEKAEDRDELIIYVPLVDELDDKAEAALNIMKNSTNGLWVGLNRGENAALAAVEILNLNNEYTEKLLKYRKEHAEKVKQHDREVKNA